VAELNRRPYSGPHESQAYLRGSGLRQLLENGVRWHIPELEAERFPRCLHAAHQLTETLKQTATVHSDLHLHNVLVPHDGTPHLIDYAYSGPGHPAYDLVRLEASLLFKYLRPLGSEEEFARLQHELSVRLLGRAELSTLFPDWWSSQVNAALLAGSLRCRDEAIEVLRGYGYGAEHYLACKFVVCSWSLTIPGLQVSLIRATLSAVGRELLTGMLT
jgi:thiamine kinase-like enzyme